MQVLPLLLLLWLTASFALVQCVIKGHVVFYGLLPGIIVGLLAGILDLRRNINLARKGLFDCSMPKREQRVTFFVVCLALFSAIILLTYAGKRYFPQIEIAKMWETFLLFSSIIWFSSSIVGIYLLQRHYGQQFYVSQIGKYNLHKTLLLLGLVFCAIGGFRLFSTGFYSVSAWFYLLIGVAVCGVSRIPSPTLRSEKEQKGVEKNTERVTEN